MNDRERLDGLDSILETLRLENVRSPIIVEGQRDRSALLSLGIKGQILVFNRGISILDFCQRVSEDHRSVVLLTDWDKKGGQIGKKIREGLESLDVRVEIDTRRKLSLLCGRVITTVEELDKYMASLRDSIEGSCHS